MLVPVSNRHNKSFRAEYQVLLKKYFGTCSTHPNPNSYPFSFRRCGIFTHFQTFPIYIFWEEDQVPKCFFKSPTMLLIPAPARILVATCSTRPCPKQVSYPFSESPSSAGTEYRIFSLSPPRLIIFGRKNRYQKISKS